MATYNGHQEDVSGNLLLPTPHSLADNVELGNVASQAYTEGTFLVFNNRLCRATKAIARGNTLAIGTNLETTSVGAQLSTLFSCWDLQSKDVTVMSPSVVRATNSNSQYKSITLTNSGVYALISETTAQNHAGERTFCFFTAEDGWTSNLSMYPPSVPSGQVYFHEQNIQFVHLWDRRVLSLRYYDTKSTGATHTWQILRLHGFPGFP